jgi:hypothetical protein
MYSCVGICVRVCEGVRVFECCFTYIRGSGKILLYILLVHHVEQLVVFRDMRGVLMVSLELEFDFSVGLGLGLIGKVVQSSSL